MIEGELVMRGGTHYIRCNVIRCHQPRLQDARDSDDKGVPDDELHCGPSRDVVKTHGVLHAPR